MADLTADPVLSAIATANSKLSELPVKDGQLIFVQDKSTIALDFGGKRVLYKRKIKREKEKDDYISVNTLCSYSDSSIS